LLEKGVFCDIGTLHRGGGLLFILIIGKHFVSGPGYNPKYD